MTVLTDAYIANHEHQRRVSDLLRVQHRELPRDLEVRAALARLCVNMHSARNPDRPPKIGNRVQQSIVVVSGDTGAGKDTTVLKQVAAIAPLICPKGDSLVDRFRSVTMPSPFSLRELGRAILNSLEYRIEGYISEPEMMNLAHFHLAENGILLLHIDEFQHWETVRSVGSSDRDRDRQRISDAIKRLILDVSWPVALVVTGLPQIVNFFEDDDQVRRRCEFIHFEKIDASYAKTMTAIINQCCSIADLVPEIDPEFRLELRLIHAAMQQFGFAFEMIRSSVLCCLERGHSKLTAEHFAEVYARKYLASDALNCFRAPGWKNIEPELPKWTSAGRRRSVPVSVKGAVR